MAKNTFVPRVNQLDAKQLDIEISRLLRNDVVNSIEKLSPTLNIRFQPELELLFDSAIWACSIGRTMMTFGQEMLIISYDKDQLTRSRLCLHFILSNIPKYVKNNFEQRSIGGNWLDNTMSTAQNIYAVLSVVNFFRFLKTGKSPSLIDFFLRLEHISLKEDKRREIGYQYLTRELLWGGFMEVIGTVLPMINYYKLRRILKGCFTSPATSLSVTNVNPTFDTSTLCTFCGERPTLPHYISCGHIFCYYCLKANILTDSEYMCPSCDTKATNIKRLVLHRRL